MGKMCLDNLDLIATVVIAFATFITMVFIAMQYFVAKQKRKDDLFKIRYEFYNEIVRFIQEQLGNPCSAIHDNLSDEKVSARMEYIVYPNAVKNFTTKARWLFSDELAKWLKTKLMDSSFSIRKNEEASSKDYAYKKEKDCSWTPDEEFQHQFVSFLKLKK